VAHGRLLCIEFDPSFDWTGITRVTADDIPGENVIALIEDDQPCLVKDIVATATSRSRCWPAPIRSGWRRRCSM